MSWIPLRRSAVSVGLSRYLMVTHAWDHFRLPMEVPGTVRATRLK